MKMMNKLLIAILAVGLLQACNFKPKESPEEIAARERATADSIANQEQLVKEEKRAKREKLNAEKAEKHRLATEESSKKAKSFKNAKGETIFIAAEKMPEYDGGEEAMSKYLKDNLKYPAAARSEGEEGTVYVDFVIDKSGKVTNVSAGNTINDDVNAELKNESLRVVESMPKWKPAMNKGKAVAAGYNIPIKFELN